MTEFGNKYYDQEGRKVPLQHQDIFGFADVGRTHRKSGGKVYVGDARVAGNLKILKYVF